LKLLLVGFSLTIIPFSLFCGILAAFGARTVHINREPLTGAGGFFASLVLGPLVTLAFSLFCWLLVIIGLWIYSFFRPLVIRYTSEEET